MAYTKELHERFRQYRSKTFWHPHECRDIMDIFTASEGFLNGWWTCPECVQKWVDRLAIKFDEMETAMKQEQEKPAEVEETASEKKEKKTKKKGE